MSLEVGHGCALAFCIAGPPFGEDADGETSQHPQDPDSVAVTHAALVFVGGRIDPLMQAAFDAPVLTVGGEPLGRVQALRAAAGDQMHRFGLVLANVAIQLCDLLSVWEAGTFRGDLLRANLPAFPSAAIDLVGPRHRRRHGLRGKRPPEWRRRSGCVTFV